MRSTALRVAGAHRDKILPALNRLTDFLSCLARHLVPLAVGLLVIPDFSFGQAAKSSSSADGNQIVAGYFASQTQELTKNCLSDIRSLTDWEKQKQQRRQQLLDMLGLHPFPKKTELNPVITGGAEADGVVVENLFFESAPGLYVTGNLYRPKNQDKPLPAILYVCGHGRVQKNGISFGNKTYYQHHGAWFARNGYICLTIDTIQLGELEGIHHGTYREKMWWWNNRGYTPAGVEAWNCIRSLDYLQSRDEVDPNRIGVTGRSGGGAYSWWIAAIDERIQVAVPVAGITSLKNHVVDGCIEGHCDCMFMVNTYQWDYPMVAALIAPRPLLISNTDKDRIFPLDGVVDVHQKVSRIYDLYGAAEQLGLHITEGPHRDTQELRIHAFRWFNRYLRGTDELIDLPATKLFEPEQLKVFDELPQDERVTTIHESFVPTVSETDMPKTRTELKRRGDRWIRQLNEQTFRSWADKTSEVQIVSIEKSSNDGIFLQEIKFNTSTLYPLALYHLSLGKNIAAATEVKVVTESDWSELSSGLVTLFPNTFSSDLSDAKALTSIREKLADQSVVIVAPRGIGPGRWIADEKQQTQIRRRFMQLGQTLAGMQVHDVVDALKVIRSVPELQTDVMRLEGNEEAATLVLYAALYSSDFDSISLGNLEVNRRSAPDLLNVSKVATVPQIAMLAAERHGHLTLISTDPQQSADWSEAINENALADQLLAVEAEAR